MTVGNGDAPKIRVAIVGSGLAGLTTAWLLANDKQQRYDVTVIDQSESPSFDSSSVTIRNNDTGHVERIDLPMRASAGSYYSKLMRMYKFLGIPLHEVRFLFEFVRTATSTATSTAAQTSTEIPEKGVDTCKSETSDNKYFIHASNLHQTPPPRPEGQNRARHVLELMYLLVCFLWFSIACKVIAPRHGIIQAGQNRDVERANWSESLDQYLIRIRLPRRFVTHYLLPLLSSVATCSHVQLLKFPASDIINYKNLSSGQPHYTVCGGVTQVQQKLLEDVNDVRLGARVLSVNTAPNSKGFREMILIVRSSGKNSEAIFDRVVLAVSPDVVCGIYQPLALTRELIPTAVVESSVTAPRFELGTEGKESAMFSILSDADDKGTNCMHHHQNSDDAPAQTIRLRTRFNKDSRTEALHTMPSGIIVSTCPLDPATELPATVLKSAKFTRTLRTTESQAIVNRIMCRGKVADDWNKAGEWTNGRGNVWVVGAWCWDGLPLLEGCVASAESVAEDFGVDVPWSDVRS